LLAGDTQEQSEQFRSIISAIIRGTPVGTSQKEEEKYIEESKKSQVDDEEISINQVDDESES